MSESKKEVEKKVEFSWLPFWAAGFMFTLGYVGLDPLLSTYSFWQQCGILLRSWFLWPLILGSHLAGTCLFKLFPGLCH